MDIYEWLHKHFPLWAHHPDDESVRVIEAREGSLLGKEDGIIFAAPVEIHSTSVLIHGTKDEYEDIYVPEVQFKYKGELIKIQLLRDFTEAERKIYPNPEITAIAGPIHDMRALLYKVSGWDYGFTFWYQGTLWFNAYATQETAERLKLFENQKQKA